MSSMNCLYNLINPMNDQAEDTTLILGLRNGHMQSLTVLFNRFYSPLCLFAERMIADKPAAEEIVDESFLKLWTKRKDFESIRSIKSFLYIVTRHACLNFLKKAARQATQQKQFSYLAEKNDDYILNEIIRAEVLQEIFYAIEKLPDKCGQVFQLSFLSGLSNHEIADKLNISVNTVKNQKVKALQLLRIKLFQNEGMILCLLFPLLTRWMA